MHQIQAHSSDSCCRTLPWKFIGSKMLKFGVMQNLELAAYKAYVSNKHFALVIVLLVLTALSEHKDVAIEDEFMLNFC